MSRPENDAASGNPPAGAGAVPARGPSPKTPPGADGPRREALRNARLAWGLALVLQGLNLVYELRVAAGVVIDWPLRPALLALVLLLVAVGVAHTARLQAYKRGWKGRCVTPEAYLRGNLLMLATLTLAACLMLGGTPFTGVDRGIVRTLSLALTLATALNWPHGRPMLPPEPAATAPATPPATPTPPESP